MRIIYIYDALCGWCYGFSPVISRLADEYAGVFEFDVLSGGMVTGSRVGPISHMRAYIEQAYPTVEERTGVRFGEGYLQHILRSDTYISDSLKPGIAMTVFKNYHVGQAVRFAADLQKALHFDGIDLNVDESYGPLVAPYGIDPNEFVANLTNPANRQQTLDEFANVQQWGISGFPTVVLEAKEKLYLLARGYMPYESLQATVEKALAL